MAERTEIRSDTERRMSTAKTAIILIATIGAVVAGLAAFLWYLAPETGDAAVSGHGTVAMILGVVFSLIVGVGLMGLVFYSSRRGYDEEASTRRRDPHADGPGEER